MELPFSPRTVREYLPLLNSIYAGFEVDIQRSPQIDDHDWLQVMPVETGLGHQEVNYAMGVLDNWLQGTDFEVRDYAYVYKKKEAKWTDFIRIFDAKILEHQNRTPVIVLITSSTGRITRNLEGIMLWHKFEKDSQKHLLLQRLAEQENLDCVPTETLRVATGAKTTQVVNKAVKGMRATLEFKLKLPSSTPIIGNDRGSGYRIDPLYNVILVD